MNPSTYKRAVSVFLRACSYGENEQRAIVEEECGDDHEMQNLVTAMLERDRKSSEYLTESERGSTSAGTEIGPYRLLEVLGEGGMGTVYLAEQKEPICRKVAVKVIQLGTSSRDVLARFDMERQALALMNHPNIARIFDAGVHEGGQPFFAMEYVPGDPITEYCDDYRLTIEERLRLFVEVCDAVQHAHQNGIIHRDIKPKNVLVANENGKPVPKVIDFGIAKPTLPLKGKTVHTKGWQLIGTPQYMSPEQTESNGRHIDTRTDIYSLGVLLYELLGGRSPIDHPEDASLEELLERIRDEEPIKLSLCASLENGAELAKSRRLTPRSLTRKLHGDLDWIVLKALEKDRTRRYSAASEFAADIERHLRHDLVLAGPPNAFYRLQKLIRRHRIAFVTASPTVST